VTDARPAPASFSGATLDDWRRHGWGFQYRGHSVVYHDEGAGEVVVCIHGFPTASYDWSRVWPRFGQQPFRQGQHRGKAARQHGCDARRHLRTHCETREAWASRRARADCT
jgi:pimeloyl-ACP methyl ester carboxylesterase